MIIDLGSDQSKLISHYIQRSKIYGEQHKGTRTNKHKQQGTQTSKLLGFNICVTLIYVVNTCLIHGVYSLLKIRECHK